jgi:hypothetical protein
MDVRAADPDFFDLEQNVIIIFNLRVGQICEFHVPQTG